MIIKLEGNGFVGVPGKEPSDIVDLCPGYSEIEDARWKSVRHNAKRLLASGTITEELTKVDISEAKDAVITIPIEDEKEGKVKCFVPSKLKDIDRKGNKVLNVVHETFHLPTLRKWYEEELRQDVRVELQKQIDGVEKGTVR